MVTRHGKTVRHGSDHVKYHESHGNPVQPSAHSPGGDSLFHFPKLSDQLFTLENPNLEKQVVNESGIKCETRTTSRDRRGNTNKIIERPQSNR